MSAKKKTVAKQPESSAEPKPVAQVVPAQQLTTEVVVQPAQPTSGRFKSTRQVTSQPQVQEVVAKPEAAVIDVRLPKLDQVTDSQQLKPYIEAYLTILDERSDMKSLGFLSTRSVYVGEPDQIILPIATDLDVSLFNHVRDDFAIFLKQATGIKSLVIESVRQEIAQDAKRPYTPEEKFAVLAQRNPAVALLRQKFMMDFEY